MPGQIVADANNPTWLYRNQDLNSDGEYAPGAVVAISSDPPPATMSFLEWFGDTATVANVNEADTTITMPAADASVTAIYKHRGDFNADGAVNIVDLNMVLIDWGKTGYKQ